MSVTGNTYSERGVPVLVLTGWGPNRGVPDAAPWMVLAGDPSKRAKTGPRNVLIERADGSRVVRPFRGLRKPTGDAS